VHLDLLLQVVLQTFLWCLPHFLAGLALVVVVVEVAVDSVVLASSAALAKPANIPVNAAAARNAVFAFAFNLIILKTLIK
jgi:hypothetical protein